MFGHVPAVRAGIAFAAEHVEKDVFYGHAKCIGDGFLAIVREEPVVARFHEHDRPDLEFFVATRRCEERDFSLPGEDLQPLLDVIHPQHLPEEFLDDGIRNNPFLTIALDVGGWAKGSSGHNYGSPIREYMFGRYF